jgi:hypothetical protein
LSSTTTHSSSGSGRGCARIWRADSDRSHVPRGGPRPQPVGTDSEEVIRSALSGDERGTGTFHATSPSRWVSNRFVRAWPMRRADLLPDLRGNARPLVEETDTDPAVVLVAVRLGHQHRDVPTDDFGLWVLAQDLEALSHDDSTCWRIFAEIAANLRRRAGPGTNLKWGTFPTRCEIIHASGMELKQ